MRLGFSELLFIFAIVLILFGPAKLPQLGRSLGEAIKNFKSGLNSAAVSVEEQDNDER